MKPGLGLTLTAILLAPPLSAQDRCQSWLGPTFWETTTVAEVTKCLAAGADPNGRDEDGLGLTPLFYAAAFSDLKVVEVLLAAGADPNAYGRPGHPSPLGLLVRLLRDGNRLRWPAGLPEKIQALLAAGADPNVRISNGDTLLHWAVRIQVRRWRFSGPPVRMVEALLAAGADPNARDNDEGETPMFNAVRPGTTRRKDGELELGVGEPEKAEVVEALLAAGADPNVKNNDGNTPLAVALFGVYNDPEIDSTVVEALLAGGADPDDIGTIYRSGAGQREIERLGLRSSATSPAAPAPQGRCLIPGFPDPPDPESLGFPWCPASVGFQVRSFALAAAGMQCAIATGSSSTPEQIEARNRETRDVCARLDAVAERSGGAECRCPASWRSP